MTPAPDRCRSCSAPIVWCKTDAGRNMPIDIEPADDGNIAVYTAPDDDHLHAQVVRPGEPVAGGDSGLRYRSHFSTCPNGERHRRR